MPKKRRNAVTERWNKVLALVGLAAGFGSWGYFDLAPDPSIILGSVLILTAFLFLTAAFWHSFDWPLKLKAPALLAALLASGLPCIKWIEYTVRPSFSFVVPCVFVNGNSWDFCINHRGPKASHLVEILFVDLDRRREVLKNNPAGITQNNIDSYERLISLPEVDPKGLGHIFATQFLWTSAVPQHEHYSIDITSREERVHQDLQMELVDRKWVWATQITDADSGKKLLSCRDPGFPYGPETPVRCFPEVSEYSK